VVEAKAGKDTAPSAAVAVAAEMTTTVVVIDGGEIRGSVEEMTAGNAKSRRFAVEMTAKTAKWVPWMTLTLLGGAKSLPRDVPLQTAAAIAVVETTMIAIIIVDQDTGAAVGVLSLVVPEPVIVVAVGLEAPRDID
jgi:NaMN:DMB phosphoribosyltransferase